MHQSFLKQDGETPLQYCIRLVKGKSEGLYDIDYTELFKLLFNIEISSDEARKRFYGIKALVDIIEKDEINNISDNDILQKIENKKMELEEEKIKFRDQRREFMKLLREKARLENIKEYIQQIAAEIAQKKPLEWNMPQNNEYNEYGKHSSHEGVLLLGDWHYSLEIDNYWNKYNIDKCLKRIQSLVLKVIEYGHFHKIDKLHVINLGDLISGIIHVSTRIANTEDVITQTQEVAEILAEMLSKFASEFKEVYYYDVLDNHSRVTPDKKEVIDKEIFARFIPWYLKTRIVNIPNIKIMDNQIDDEIVVTEICNNIVFAVHGHRDNTSQIIKNLTLMCKKFPKYIFTAHGHHLESNEEHCIEYIMNRSLMGTDDYAKSLRRTSKSGQLFIIFDKNGKKCIYDIVFD